MHTKSKFTQIAKKLKGNLKNMDLLSPTSKKIYEYIKRTVSEKGYSPSVRDIKNELNIKSTSTVQLHIKRLEDAGYIYKEEL